MNNAEHNQRDIIIIETDFPLYPIKAASPLNSPKSERNQTFRIERSRLHYISDQRTMCGMPYVAPAIPELLDDREGILEESNMTGVSIMEYIL